MSSSIDIDVWKPLNSESSCLIFNKSSSKFTFFRSNFPTFVLFNEKICPFTVQAKDVEVRPQEEIAEAHSLDPISKGELNDLLSEDM